MHCTNKHRKRHMKRRHNKKTKKHLVKNKKTRKGSRKYSKSKSKKQSGGYESMSLTSNPLTWTVEDVGNYLMSTLNGAPVPVNSNPTHDQF